MEGKKSVDAQIEAKAEALFREKVKDAMEENPLSSARPLKYRPGVFVIVVTNEDEELKVKIKKGRAGVYMGQVATEGGDTVPVVFDEEAVKMDIN